MNETGYLTNTGQSYDWESHNPTNVVCSPDGTFAVGATTACDFDMDLLSFSLPGLVQVSTKNILLVVAHVLLAPFLLHSTKMEQNSML
jgi:hypothetical protein